MNDPLNQLEILKDKIDTSSNFIDYFVEIGVKPDIFRDTFLYESSLEDLNTQFKDKLSPSIISKFPSFDKKSISIDESIISHIFPSGFKVIKSSSQPSNVPFSLVLDNRFLSAQYPNKFISCLLIYESISAYKSLYDIYSNIETNTLLSRYTSSNSNIGQIEKEKEEEYCSYYIPKCLCFISVYPFLDSHSKLLLDLYSFAIKSKANRNKILIDKLIESIVLEIPAPSRGLHKVQFKFLDKEAYEYKQNQLNNIPSLDFEMEKIFKLFKVEDILDIVKYFMQEVKLLFFSKYIRNLTPVILGFVSFLLPFKYPFQVITILSENQFDFIESISPYIIGINQTYNANFFKDHSIEPPMNVVIINIDRGEIEVISSCITNVKTEAQKKKILGEEFPDFPHSYRSKLEKKLNKYITEVNNRKVQENREVYSKCFLSFIAKVMSSYSKFLIYDYSESHKTNGDISSLFNSKEYYSSFNGNDKLFYKKLTETQMFIEFIYQRMLPRDTNEKIEVLFFDEHIVRKMQRVFFSKNSTNVFITSDAYNHNQIYQVSTQRERGLSDKDIEFFNIIGNRQIALLNGNNCEMLTNDEIIFTYYVFPTLLTDHLFIYNISHYYIPPQLSKDLNELNSEMLSKANMTYGNHLSEMENYIYLSWVNIWALTFWYQEPNEKEYWFTRLLKVLDLIWNHEIETFEYLFNVLKTHGTKAMIIQLYSRLIKYRLTPTWEIFTLMSNIDDHIAAKLKTLVKSKEIKSRGSGFNLNQFAPRTLKDSNDIHILTEEVLFYAYDNCINCQTQFNLFKECKDFKSMQREEMWIKCLHCNNNFLPTLKFRFGIELYNQEEETPNNNNNNMASSSIDNIVLDSPKYLRENLSSITHKEKGCNFDVEAFKLKYKKVFWNLIWYFKLMNLDITLMLPYLPMSSMSNARKNSLSESMPVISNFLHFSTAKSICVASSSKSLLKRTVTMTDETALLTDDELSGIGNTFDVKGVRVENVIQLEMLPMVEQSPFNYNVNVNSLNDGNVNMSFSGYTANYTDINSCVNDNLFADNSIIMDTVSKFSSEDNCSDNEIKFKRNYNKLKSIKEDFEEALNFNNDKGSDKGSNDKDSDKDKDMNDQHHIVFDHDDEDNKNKDKDKKDVVLNRDSNKDMVNYKEDNDDDKKKKKLQLKEKEEEHSDDDRKNDNDNGNNDNDDPFNMDLKDAHCFGTFTEDTMPQNQYDEDEEERKRNIMFSFGNQNTK